MSSQATDSLMQKYVTNQVLLGLAEAQLMLSPITVPLKIDSSQLASSISGLSSGLASAMNSAVSSFSAGN